jgi:site-specific DNA recombinase
MSAEQKTEQIYSLIYCRVSSQKQVDEGDGSGSQEQRCRVLSQSKQYIIERVFKDDGVSGGLFDRPAMQELLRYIDEHPYKNYVVIFDDLKRFARDYDVHKRLKLEFRNRGVRLECLNFNFEDSPEGEFIEGVLALQGELERKQNRRQVIQKQKSRLDRGFWPFCPPLGLRHVKDKEHGKILVPREPYATIFKEAIEGYANNLLNTQHEVRAFIEARYKEHGIDRGTSIHGTYSVLTEELYAGYVEYEPWEVPRRKGQHEGFISPEIFEAVQDKLFGRTKPKLVKSYSIDFPLRRFVTCSHCGKKLRASWNTGKTKKYPNYWCQTEGCPYEYKVTKAWTIEEQFQEILSQVKITEDGAELAKAIFADVWESSKQEMNLSWQRVQQGVLDIDEQIETLALRVSTAKVPELISTYETQIEKLVKKKTELLDVVPPPSYSPKDFGTQLDKVIKVLENPLLLWNSDNPEDKRTILYMYFENGLDYTYGEGFGTPKYSEAINLFQDLSSGKIPDVEMRGNEPLSATAHQHHLQTYIIFHNVLDGSDQTAPIHGLLNGLLNL